MMLTAALLFALGSPVILQAQAYELVERDAGLHTAEPGIGVSTVDFNSDGWDDITIALLGAPPAIFRNNQDGTFSRVGELLGIVHSEEANTPIWVDVNNDGRLDLFLAQHRVGENRLYIAQNNGTYQNRLAEFGLDPKAKVGSAAFADFDGDGFVDVFLAIRRGADLLFKNEEGSGFRDVTEDYGVAGETDTVPMQAGWIDYDRDGDPDLLATHDLDWESRFYRNDGPVQWPEIARDNGLANVGPGSSMGMAWGDTNLDGAPDAYISRIEFGGLYMNNGFGIFSDEANALGGEVNGVSWGVVLSDFDNDMDEDLAIASTTLWRGNDPHMFWTNDGGFFAPTQEGFIPWSKGLASGDFNRDGRMDLVVASTKGDHRLLLNQTPNVGNWLGISLGRGPLGQTPVGARLELDVAGITLTRWVHGGNSYCSQSSNVVHFGLGPTEVVDEVRVYRGTEIIEQWQGVAANQVLQHGDISVSVSTEHIVPELERSNDGGHQGIWPNPAGEQATISVHALAAGLASIVVFDALGRERLSSTRPVTLGANRIGLDLGGLVPGLYFVRLDLGSQGTTRSLVRR